MDRSSKNKLVQKIEELKTLTSKIEAMDINDKWKECFTDMIIYRNWRKLDPIKINRLLNISNINSPSVLTIIEQKHTKLSLAKIEKIAVIVTDEPVREKIKNILLTHSWERAKKDIDLLVSSYQNEEE